MLKRLRYLSKLNFCEVRVQQRDLAVLSKFSSRLSNIPEIQLKLRFSDFRRSLK